MLPLIDEHGDERTTGSAQLTSKHVQCDQMVKLFFNIWPFVTVMQQIFQSRFNILPNLVLLSKYGMFHCLC